MLIVMVLRLKVFVFHLKNIDIILAHCVSVISCELDSSKPGYRLVLHSIV